ncbi:MAG: hypothetical protein IT428_11815 [Planctomycetaceae bacterium]|nr:hypothetical protein [Planctomycetaceae bacterium]
MGSSLTIWWRGAHFFEAAGILILGLVSGTLLVIDLFTRITSSNLGTFHSDHDPAAYWVMITLQISFYSAIVLGLCIVPFAASQS